jgi:lipoprotein-anchoring transpeptidase ErfK/SrfK
MSISRRHFLKLGAAGLALGLSPRLALAAGRAAPGVQRWGRVTHFEADVRLRPDPESGLVRTVKFDDVLPMYGVVGGAGELPHNSVWYRLADGFIYSSWVQPVAREFNQPLAAVAYPGVWAEVTVPYTDARAKPQPGAEVIYRLYYSAVFQVVGRVEGEAGAVWYTIRDKGGQRLYAPARALRPIAPDDLSPISPGVPGKRLVIGLNQQMLVAYEGESPVFQTRVSTGTSWFGEAGALLDFNTPFGEHRVYSKWIADHMRGDDFDLPGVAWVTYFTESGAAVHSTYWHKVYGRPRSHGCVNAPPAAARWVFRWTAPDVPYHPGLARGRGNSTPIFVQYDV